MNENLKTVVFFTKKVWVFVWKPKTDDKHKKHLWDGASLLPDWCRGTWAKRSSHPDCFIKIYICGPERMRFALCLFCLLQSASVRTKASLCGFNLIMNPTHSAFFCSLSKLVWLLAAFRCWSICLSVSPEITSARPCLPLGFHFIYLAQQKGIKRDDWLDASSSDKLLPIHLHSDSHVYDPKAK